MSPTRLSLFNSPPEAFCTGPPKYNLNPYLGGCSHGCLYCYAPKFPSFNGPTRPRLNLLSEIEEMARRTAPKLPVMLSDCTDPYLPLEAEFRITRRCIEVLARGGFPLLIVTKSDLFTRDLDLLGRARAVVAVTVTTLDEGLASIIEPGAPQPQKRLGAIGKAAESGVRVVARVDPLIPGLTDDEGGLERLFAALKEGGVERVTVSTLKLVRGVLQRFEKVDRGVAASLRELYEGGGWILGYKYLPTPMRLRILEGASRAAMKVGLRLSACREGFPHLDTLYCDGARYLGGEKRAKDGLLAYSP